MNARRARKRATDTRPPINRVTAVSPKHAACQGNYVRTEPKLPARTQRHLQLNLAAISPSEAYQFGGHGKHWTKVLYGRVASHFPVVRRFGPCRHVSSQSRL